MTGASRPAAPWNLSIGGDSQAVTPSDGRAAIALTGPQAGTQNGVQMRDKSLLRVISNEELVQQEDAALQLQREKEQEQRLIQEQGIVGHIRERWSYFRNVRETRGISIRLVESLRAYRGQYSEQKLQSIQQFAGSDVYCRLTALKCRGATAMLRDIYLSGERSWHVLPTPNPTLPDDISSSINELVMGEVQFMQQNGQPVDERTIQMRREQLMDAAKLAAQDKAAKEARQATRYMDDILVEGGFYDALVEFLINISIFPYAFMKGPVVEMVTDVKWENGEAVEKDIPQMRWYTPNPFDIFWDSGTRNFEDTDVIEKIRLKRTDLANLIGVPGYSEEAIREVLRMYGNGGLSDWLDYTDTIRARLEQKEDPHINQSGHIDTLEFHGGIQGSMLREYGFTEEQVPDSEVDYHCIAWLIGHHLIKVQIDPNPRKRHPYYMTSFDVVPGTEVGHGIPELIHDIQDVANASLRAMVNNLSIASGPQVVVNDDRLVNNMDAETLYPWKRWRVSADPYGNNSEKPVDFFQPASNAQELLLVFNAMFTLADEVSAIPRYMQGSMNTGGGAGDTASGLSMLMQSASKTLQSVAANIDNDILKPLLRKLHDTILLTDESGHLRGDENIEVRGVVFATQRERERARLLEFLQMTANPIDLQIMGVGGRAELLREASHTLNLDHKQIIPDPEQMGMQTAAGMGPTIPDAASAQGAKTPGPPAEAGAVDEGMKALPRGPSGAAV